MAVPTRLEKSQDFDFFAFPWCTKRGVLDEVHFYLEISVDSKRLLVVTARYLAKLQLLGLKMILSLQETTASSRTTRATGHMWIYPYINIATLSTVYTKQKLIQWRSLDALTIS